MNEKCHESPPLQNEHLQGTLVSQAPFIERIRINLMFDKNTAYRLNSYWQANSSRHFLKQFNLTCDVTAVSRVVPLLSMTTHLLDICLKYLEEWCACTGLKGANCLHRKSTCCVITVPILATFQKEKNHALRSS